MSIKKVLFYYAAYAVGIYVVQRVSQKGFVPTNYLTDPIGTIVHYPNGLV